MDTLSEITVASIQSGITPEAWERVVRPELLTADSISELIETIEDYQDSLNPDIRLHQRYHIECEIWLDYLSDRQIGNWGRLVAYNGLSVKRLDPSDRVDGRSYIYGAFGPDGIPLMLWDDEEGFQAELAIFERNEEITLSGAA